MGKAACLSRMPGDMRLERFDIPLPKDMVEPSVKVGISLLYVSLIHGISYP